MSGPPDPSAAPDQELIVSILEGSSKACRELHDRYEDRVYSLLCHMVHDPEAANDLKQESFLKAFASLTSFSPDRPFWPWIRTIANNTAVDYLRNKTRDARARELWLNETTPGRRLSEGVPAIDKTPSPSGGYPIAAYQALLQAIEQLKEPYRQLYLLRDVQKRSYDDIAKSLRVPAGTVRSYVHRARKQLEQMLAPLLEISPTPP
jgi:RNA polymerase sigma-70 factor (ECF subfamily)